MLYRKSVFLVSLENGNIHLFYLFNGILHIKRVRLIRVTNKGSFKCVTREDFEKFVINTLIAIENRVYFLQGLNSSFIAVTN